MGLNLQVDEGRLPSPPPKQGGGLLIPPHPLQLFLNTHPAAAAAAHLPNLLLLRCTPGAALYGSMDRVLVIQRHEGAIKPRFICLLHVYNL